MPEARRESRRAGASRGKRAAAALPLDPWRIAAALVTAPTLEEQLTLLLQEAPRVGGGDSATVYLVDAATGELRVAALFGETRARDVRPRPRGMTRQVLESGEQVIIQDTAADPRVNPVVPESGIRAFVGLPLIARRGGAAAGQEQPPQTTGVLYVNAHRANAFTPEAVEALTGLAALAAVAIENTLLLESQREAAEQLQNALQLREQFVSLASHELKAPLTPLKGYAQAITRRFERAAAAGEAIDEGWLRRALSIMVGQIDRLDRLVTDLLDVSRVRAGSFTLQPEPADLVALAKETFDRFRESLTETIAAETATGTPATLHRFAWRPGASALPGAWDRTRLDQLITNLLSNAVKYSPRGGTVELQVGWGEEVERAPEEIGEWRGWVHLAVRDEGVGLGGADAAEGVAHPERSPIFGAFMRGESAAESEATGFGLGLFICAEIVRRHGGTIWAESAGPGQGTTFHVLLPPEAPEASEAAA
jgi:signal transduction histidine kinase